MKISTNATKYINEYYHSAGDPAPNGVADLTQVIGAQLAAIEETIDFGKKYEGAVVVKVVDAKPIEGSDHLNVCMIDDAGAAKHVARGDDNLVQVVCGAPNVHAGMLAVWLQPGSIVPETFDGQQFKLDSRALRGVMSHGMLASARELALGDDHSGIVEVDEELGPITPGTMLVDAFHLRGDVVIDMENKMFTHRPDCFGWLGIAREIEGIQHRPYKSPDWYTLDPAMPGVETDELPLEVRSDIPQLVPRFAAIALRGVRVGPSPLWLRFDLARAGIRPINNIVDYTNFYMVLTGQPLHAYDYDKVKALCKADHAVLVARLAKKGETLPLLNGKTIELTDTDMVVATDQALLGLGGAMGGSDTEVGPDTTNIIIEAANWDMYATRRTSMAHGIFTDAVTRFTKGQSPLQIAAVMGKIVQEVRDHAHGQVASKFVDENHLSADVRKRGSLHTPVIVTRQFVNERLGWDLSTAEMATLLENVEFGVSHTPDELTVTAPFWRTDIEIPEDVVEEIGRLNGYDKLPLVLPRRDMSAASKNPLLQVATKVRTTLANAGANELLTYSFVHGDQLAKAGQDAKHAYKISNALSPDLQYYRTSLTPSLLEKVHNNIKAGYKQFCLFEINKVHLKGDHDAEGLPREYQTVAFVFANDGAQSGAAYYQAKKYLSHLLQQFGLTLGVMPMVHEPGFEIGRQVGAPFDPARSGFANVDGDQFIGFVGEYKPGVAKAFKLPAGCAGFEIDLERLLQLQKPASYQPLGRFPSSQQDICFKVISDLPYAELLAAVQAGLPSDATLHTTIEPFSIYQKAPGDAHKQITLRLNLQHAERTLTTGEVNDMLDALAAHVAAKAKAERV